jgi:poly(3-hydroxybutyrate) depolymerase
MGRGILGRDMDLVPDSSVRSCALRRLVAVVAALALVAAGCGNGDDGTDATAGDDAAPTAPAAGGDGEGDAEADGVAFERVEDVTTTDDYAGEEGLERWQAEVDGIREVEVPSSVDDHQQPVLWLPPTGAGPQPLLVAVHSWSYGYLQHAQIPYARWAEREGWAMVHPHFRGVFEAPDATGSDLAVQDVIDAVDFALETGDVDPDRIYVVGYSGGGMMSLLLAGRHPERFAGVVSFVPIYDLIDWYAYNEEEGTEYVDQIAASCGDDPTAEPEARQECEHRSPASHLDGAREAGLPVYIAHGLDDDVVPPHHALQAFNHLADLEDRLPDDAVEALRQNELPDELGGATDAESFFGGDDPDVYAAIGSGPVTLVLFDGEHDMAYHPGLEWMVRGAPGR